MKKLTTLKKSNKGITLISLVITIIVLLILAGVTLKVMSGDNGILSKSTESANKNQEETAKEKMNLKITNLQMQSYVDNQRMPTLHELANGLLKDDEIADVWLKSEETSKKSEITVGEAKSVFTKLNEYSYVFEINSDLQLASVDGVKVGSNNENYASKAELEQLRAEMNNRSMSLDYSGSVDISSYTSEGNKYTIPENGFVVVSYCAIGTAETRGVNVIISDYPYNPLLNDCNWGIHEHFSTIINKGQTIYFSFTHSSNNKLQAYFIPFK